MNTEKPIEVPFVDLGRIHKPIMKDFLNVTEEVIETSAFVLGHKLQEFERNFTDYVGAKYGLGVASGADALFLSLKSIGVKQGNEVITVNNTFNATVDAIIRAGATPKIVDAKNNDLLVDISAIKLAITKRTKAIIPVHLYGNPIDMKLLNEIRDEVNSEIIIIQDAAQAHGALYANKPLGEYGDILCYSFYPGKNLGSLGEGGFVATDNLEVIEKIRILRNCGQKSKYYHTDVGYNSRLENLQAAYLNIKLKVLGEWNESRRKTAHKYNVVFEDLENVEIVQETHNGKHVYHLFVIRTKQRDRLKEILIKNHIQFGIHYPVPISKTEAYRSFYFSKSTYPITERAANEVISIPMFPYMRNDEIDHVIEAISHYNELVFR